MSNRNSCFEPRVEKWGLWGNVADGEHGNIFLHIIWMWYATFPLISFIKWWGKDFWSVHRLLALYLYSLDSWASLVAQMVKNPLAGSTWVQFLGWEDPLEEGMSTHSSILAWRIPMDRRACWAAVLGAQRVRHDWATQHSTARIHTEVRPCLGVEAQDRGCVPFLRPFLPANHNLLSISPCPLSHTQTYHPRFCFPLNRHLLYHLHLEDHEHCWVHWTSLSRDYFVIT